MHSKARGVAIFGAFRELRPTRLAVVLASTALGSCFAVAQNPDLVFNIDGRMQFLTGSEGPTFVRFYDNLGRHSVGSITFFTEIGFQGYVSEKFEKIPNDADRDSLDQYYIEDTGIWRVGKQYLPFGSGKFFHDSVLAVRGDTQLVVEGLPIVIAACDNGSGRQRGVVARVGSRLGFSLAFGTHFGINATSFTLVRRPEDSPGVGHGYKTMLGMDYTKNIGSLFDVGGEMIIVQDGNTPQDHDDTMFDLSATLKDGPRRQITFGWTRDNAQGADFYRVMGSFTLSRYLILEPIIRYRNASLFDAGLSFHFKF
ncbi:MAG TPA: hypothetical protein VG820_05910 [Fimbriimonadaceae bacterium]|nr:hypothetical protein [Fimbriimonadaceae bacterium]